VAVTKKLKIGKYLAKMDKSLRLTFWGHPVSFTTTECFVNSGRIVAALTARNKELTKVIRHLMSVKQRCFSLSLCHTSTINPLLMVG